MMENWKFADDNEIRSMVLNETDAGIVPEDLRNLLKLLVRRLANAVQYRRKHK